MLRALRSLALVLCVTVVIPVELEFAAQPSLAPQPRAPVPSAVNSAAVVPTVGAPASRTNMTQPQAEPEPRTLDGVAWLNRVRTRAGLNAVTIDSWLSAAAQAHADYLVRNRGNPQLAGLNAHTEDLSLPLASEAGRDAGLNSDIDIRVNSVFDAVQGLLEAPLHQASLLDPNLQRVGVGAGRSGADFDVVIDVGHGINGHV